jgi:hemolysin activation/secretion protein
VEVGRYGEIIIENESSLQEAVIKKLTKRLHKGEIICRKELETALYNIIDLGGVKAGAIMSPGDNVGQTNIAVRVEDGKRESYILYSENYGNKASGRYRYGAAANWYEMKGQGDHLAVSGSISSERQHNYGIQYDQLVGSDGTRLGISIGRTDYELGSRYADSGAVGQAVSVGLYGNTPVWKTSDSSLSLVYGWDYRNLKDEMREFDYAIEKHSNSFYAGIDGMKKMPRTRVNYDFMLHAGRLTPDDARIGSIPLQVSNQGTYNKAVLNTAVVQSFDKNLDMVVKLQAQRAGSTLDSSEQIFLGGANAVRAYPQGEGAGDEGYQATAELLYRTKVPGLTVSSFFDIGHVKYTKNDSIPGGTTLKGWGIGLAYNEPSGYWLRLDYARRIGLAKDASEDAKSKQRVWFITGRSW